MIGLNSQVPVVSGSVMGLESSSPLVGIDDHDQPPRDDVTGAPTFRLRARSYGTTVDLTVSGVIDLESADAFALAVLRWTPRMHGTLIVDLRQVSFMDAAGLGALIRIRTSPRRSALELRTSRRIDRLLDITGQSDCFTVRVDDSGPC